MSDSPQPFNGDQHIGNSGNNGPNEPYRDPSRTEQGTAGQGQGVGAGQPTAAGPSAPAYAGQDPFPTIANPAPASRRPASGGRRARPEHLSACGVTALVLGIVGTVLSFIPIVNNVAAILGIIGLVFGVIGLVGVFRGKKRGKGITIAGAVLSVLAIVITLGLQSSLSKAIDKADPTYHTTTSQQAKGKSHAKTQDTEGDLQSGHVKIVSVARSDNDYNNAPTVLVTYQWTNKTDRNQSFGVVMHAQAFQNGQELDTAVYNTYPQGPQGYDENSALAQVQPSAQGTATVGYVLVDDSPVTIEVGDMFSVTDKAKVTHVYNL
ncbi:DUF5067 domain-containing protein [Bifidobacterium sp. ESL0763]|uniref:DUF5067 domain-containing protein n=1 Tax=Bifidobacterium sp. ESL0763 TaxID=2983227 RepID=UPI0023F68BB3|nr:DUF5067 domain-containing protein [Bifidobacterium sp. ESL0763]MDF7664090.1 DUF5067 domain-containing protein [Bifidobacterium sp. ESL0763]